MTFELTPVASSEVHILPTAERQLPEGVAHSEQASGDHISSSPHSTSLPYLRGGGGEAGPNAVSPKNQRSSWKRAFLKNNVTHLGKFLLQDILPLTVLMAVGTLCGGIMLLLKKNNQTSS